MFVVFPSVCQWFRQECASFPDCAVLVYLNTGSHMLEPATFHLFGRDHLLTLLALLVAGALITRAGRRSTDFQRTWLGRMLALVLLGYAVFIYFQKAMARELTFEYALPLELCHWVLVACLISLVRPMQLASEIAYFWGLAGTLQATLTPDITEGFPSLEFILFFWSHGAILLAIVFFITCQGFRPRPHSVARMLAAVNFYALSVGGINAIFGWNYGYLCHKPVRPSLIDFLGPWPWYLATGELIALVSFWLLDLPWRILDRYRTSKAQVL